MNLELGVWGNDGLMGSASGLGLVIEFRSLKD